MKIGEDIYVKDPRRFIGDCTCIVGVLVAHCRRRGMVTLAGEVGRYGGGYPIMFSLPFEDIGPRDLGTPISQISTQPGTPGYAEWVRISRSWGFE